MREIVNQRRVKLPGIANTVHYFQITLVKYLPARQESTQVVPLVGLNYKGRLLALATIDR